MTGAKSTAMNGCATRVLGDLKIAAAFERGPAGSWRYVAWAGGR
jgi:hypothetical protein